MTCIYRIAQNLREEYFGRSPATAKNLPTKISTLDNKANLVKKIAAVPSIRDSRSLPVDQMNKIANN